jgi:hypothetical protein
MGWRKLENFGLVFTEGSILAPVGWGNLVVSGILRGVLGNSHPFAVIDD